MFDSQLFKLPGAIACAAKCGALALLSAFMVIVQVFTLSAGIVDVWSGKPFESVLWLIGVFVISFILRRVALEAQDAVACAFADSAVLSLSTQLKHAIFSGGPAAFSTLGRAGSATLLVDGMDEIRDYISISIPKAVNMVLIPLVLVVAIFSFDLISGLIALVCYPFIIIFMQLIGHGAKEEASKTHAGFLRMTNHYMDSIKGLRTLKSFGRSKAHADKVFASSEAYRKLTMRNLKLGTLSSTVLDIFATCGLAAVAIMLGFRLAEGEITFFCALCVLMLTPEYFTPIKAYAKDYHATLKGKTSACLIDSTIAKSKMCEQRTQELIAYEDACLFNAEFSALELRNISFAYSEGGEEVLSGISFSVRAGDKVGVIGKSGAGKSTLLNLVAGLENPSSGSVVLDGREARTLRRDEWRKCVCYIPQNPFIMSASIRDNITLYVEDATDEEIFKALRSVGLDELVSNLESGLDTKLGEGGLSLSGGEAQRICLARALLDQRRSVWVLDEPTARLDEKTELELIRAIARISEGKTLFVATHSPKWLDMFTVVVDVERGSSRVN